MAAVEEGEADSAFLVRAPTIAQVAAFAARGETMPQKSTYFYPKLTSGLLLFTRYEPGPVAGAVPRGGRGREGGARRACRRARSASAVVGQGRGRRHDGGARRGRRDGDAEALRARGRPDRLGGDRLPRRRAATRCSSTRSTARRTPSAGSRTSASRVAVAEGDTIGDVFFGYVYDFGANEEWMAARGEGAFLNGEPITGAAEGLHRVPLARGDARAARLREPAPSWRR